MPLRVCFSRFSCFQSHPGNSGSSEPEGDGFSGDGEQDFTIAMWRKELADAGQKAWIVVPTARRRRALQQPLPNGAEGARLLPRIVSLAELASHLGGFCMRQSRLIGGAEQALRFSHALQATGQTHSPGMVEKAIRAWNQLHTQEPLAEEVAESIRETGRDLATRRSEALQPVMCLYREGLQADGASDFHSATENLIDELGESDSPVARWVERNLPFILLDGFHHLDKQSLRLVENLANLTEVRWWIPSIRGQYWHGDVERTLERLFLPTGRSMQDPAEPDGPLAPLAACLSTPKTESPIPLPQGALRMALVAQRRDEPSWVTAEIRSLLRDDHHLRENPHRIAIVVPDSSEATRFRMACQRAGIACSPQAETMTLESSRLARLVRVALAARDGLFSHEQLHTLLGSSQFNRKLEKKWLLPQLRRLGLGVRKAKTPEAWLEFWTHAIQRASQPDKDLPSAAEENTGRQHWAANLLDLARAASGRLRELVEVFAFVHPDKSPGSTLVSRLASFLAGLEFDTTLAGAQRPAGLPERELEEDQLAWNNLLDALEGVASTPAEYFITNPDTDEPDLATALTLAIQSESFRLRAQDTAAVQILLPEALRGGYFDILFWTGMRQDAFPPRARGEDHLDPAEPGRIEREAKLMLCQGLISTRRVVFTRPGQEGEERLQPSPFWREILKVTGLKEEPILTLQPGEEDGLWQGLRQWDETLESNPLKGEIGSWLDGIPTLVKTKDGAEAIVPQPTLESWALPLIRAIWHETRGFSPTALERFAGCPFRFFVEHTLGLKDDDENRLGMHWGNLIHQGMEEMLRPGEPFPTSWQNLTGHLVTNHAEFTEYLDDFHRHQVERTPLLLDRGGNLALLSGYSVHDSEKEFSIQINHPEVGPIVVHGRIDLVLANEGKKYPARVVVDHKTGKMTSIRGRVDSGRLLQPLIYGWALQSEQKDSNLWVEAGYLLIHPEEVEFKGSSGIPGTKYPKRAFDMKPDYVEGKIIDHVRGIRGGVISLTTFGPNHPKPECSYCPLKNTCRYPENG